MNDLLLLLKAIDRDPDDRTLQDAATDAVIEVWGWEAAEAAADIAQRAQAARDARDLDRAAVLIRPDSPERTTAITAIRRACQIHFSEAATIVLLPGDREPDAAANYRSKSGAWWYEWTVTVGASWLLASMAALREQDGRRDRRRATRGPRR